MWNLRRKLAWLVLVPVAVIAAIVLSLPLILNTADYQALLVEQAEMQLGRKVSVKRAAVEVFPYVRIALDDVVIRELDGTTQFLFADHFFIDLRVFPLLQRKVLVKRILLDKPKMAIRRGAAGILNISDLFSQGAQPSDFTTPMLGDEISIADGEFVFEDSFGAEATRTVTLRHVTTTLKRAGTQLGFKFYAALPHENTEMTFTITGQVSREALMGARPGGKAAGRLEAKGVNLSRLAMFLNDNPILRSISTPIDLAGSFEYRWAKSDRALTIKEL
ncbi:MAG: AsmA family protein, partial [Nitrospirota bacterium]